MSKNNKKINLLLKKLLNKQIDFQIINNNKNNKKYKIIIKDNKISIKKQLKFKVKIYDTKEFYKIFNKNYYNLIKNINNIDNPICFDIIINYDKLPNNLDVLCNKFNNLKID